MGKMLRCSGLRNSQVVFRAGDASLIRSSGCFRSTGPTAGFRLKSHRPACDRMTQDPAPNLIQAEKGGSPTPKRSAIVF